MIWIIGAIVVFFLIRNKQLTLSAAGKILGALLIFVGFVSPIAAPPPRWPTAPGAEFKVGQLVHPKFFGEPKFFSYCVAAKAGIFYPQGSRVERPQIASQFAPFKILELGSPLTVMSMKTGQVGTLMSDGEEDAGFVFSLGTPAPIPNTCSSGYNR